MALNSNTYALNTNTGYLWTGTNTSSWGIDPIAAPLPTSVEEGPLEWLDRRIMEIREP
jgi:hypothetical protein